MLRLIAGSDTEFGTPTGGDVKVTGSGAIDVPNAVTQVFSGSAANSTGLSALAAAETVATWAPTVAAGENTLTATIAGSDPAISTSFTATGTLPRPFTITTAEDLLLLVANPDGDFILNPDGDGPGGTFMVPSPWTPIGSAPGVPFTGSLKTADGEPVIIKGLDGQPLFDVIGAGAEVSGLTISGNVREDADGPAGLFANVIEGEDGNPAVISDITIEEDSSIIGADGEDNIGGLAGTIKHAELSNIVIDAGVTGNGDQTGGVGGTISDSELDEIKVTGEVKGEGTNTGGIAGSAEDTDISGATVNGGVTGERDNTGH